MKEHQIFQILHFQKNLVIFLENIAKLFIKLFNDVRKGYYVLDFARSPTTFKILEKTLLIGKGYDYYRYMGD